MKTLKMKIKYSLLLVIVALFSINSYTQTTTKESAGKTTVIVTATPDPNGKESMGYYTKRGHKLLLATKAVGVSLYYAKEKIHGETAMITFVVEFPNDQSVKDFFNGKEYQALMEYRYKGFHTFNICIVTLGDAEIK